ncbi:hypothetical protein, partial [Nocardioides malaquae]|uniref:hypothetical protein n=1 Tax=Nocardioides malaquae TaxID=2773426 RepID=UPI001D0D59C8
MKPTQTSEGLYHDTTTIKPTDLMDTVTYKSLVEDILKHIRHFRWGHSFGRAVNLTRAAGKDPASVLLAG